MQNELAAAFPDGYPVTEGHMLIVPKRHQSDYFQLTRREQEAILELTGIVQRRLSDDPTVSGFNVGINVGDVAGQTVGHAHVHIIPRREGDVGDPRGGVRWVIPERAAYWKD